MAKRGCLVGLAIALLAVCNEVAAEKSSSLRGNASVEKGSKSAPSTGVWGERMDAWYQNLDAMRGLGATGPPGVNTPFEWTGKNIGALILACVCASLANAAGIGGGPFYVPLFNILLGFQLRECTPLSHTLMASSAVGSTIFALYQRSPVDANRPMVNFDIALTFIPILLFGNSLGVLIGSLIPEWLQTALLTFLLLFVVFKTGKKGITTFRSEQAARRRNKGRVQPVPSDADLDAVLLVDEEYVRPVEFEKEGYEKVMGTSAASSEASGPLLDPVKPDAEQPATLGFGGAVREFWRRFPFTQFSQMMVLWGVFMALQLGKGLAPTCSSTYWGYWAAQIALCSGMTAFYLVYVNWRLGREPEGVDEALKAILQGTPDAHGNRQSMVVRLGTVVTMMMLAGLIAGLLGVGGALVFNPYLLELGVHPQVTAATSVLMILFSSGSILLSFAFQHLVNASYAAVFVPFCFIASFFGAQLVGYVVDKTQRTSIVIAILSGLLLLGALATGIFGGLRSATGIRHGSPIGFTPLCG